MEHCHHICQVRFNINIQYNILNLYDISRPLVMTGVCILVVYLLYLYYFANSRSGPLENSPPNHHKNVEHIHMKESDLEEMDETEHLYLEL